jgi:glutamate 5-kinase
MNLILLRKECSAGKDCDIEQSDKVSEEAAKMRTASLAQKGENVVVVSALKGWGIDTLKAMIKTKSFDRAAMLRAKRIVIKIGTSILLDKYKRVSIDMIRNFARQVRALKEMKREVIIVSSGAIACGMEALNLKKKPREIEKRQALASIGKFSL